MSISQGTEEERKSHCIARGCALGADIQFGKQEQRWKFLFGLGFPRGTPPEWTCGWQLHKVYNYMLGRCRDNVLIL